MNRTQKKCLIVSSTLHALLIGILLFGAALMPSEKTVSFTPIKLYTIATDGPTTGGGPKAQGAPPPPQPPAPQVAEPVQPVQPRQVELPKPPVEPRTKTTEAEPVKTQKYTLDPKELKLTKRDNVKPVKDTTAANEKAASDKAAKAAADARARAINQAVQNIKGIGKDFSHTTDVVLSGNGEDGPAAANYRDIVASKYTAAWNPPANLDDDSAAVTVKVTIERGGTVVEAHIVKSSGNPAMDRSIESTLQNVTYVEAFPPGSKDQERTYTIKFNLAAKRLLG